MGIPCYLVGKEIFLQIKEEKNLELLKFPLSLLVASDQVRRLHGDLQQTALRQHVRRSLKSVTHSLI